MSTQQYASASGTTGVLPDAVYDARALEQQWKAELNEMQTKGLKEIGEMPSDSIQLGGSSQINGFTYGKPQPIDLGAPIYPPRVALLSEAIALTTGDRQTTYGDFVANMQHMAQLVNVQLGTDFDAHDACIVMALGKLSRIRTGVTHRDNYLDAANYIAAAFEAAESMGRLHHGTV